MFPVWYGLNSYIIFRGKSVFEVLTGLTDNELHLMTEAVVFEKTEDGGQLYRLMALST